MLISVLIQMTSGKKGNICLLATSFPGSLILPLAPGGGKMRDPGNEVGLLAAWANTNHAN